MDLNNINQIFMCVCCEVIVIGETIVLYVWILKPLCTFESRWNSEKIRTFFGDRLTTMIFLQDLGIEHSCFFMMTIII